MFEELASLDLATGDSLEINDDPGSIFGVEMGELTEKEKRYYILSVMYELAAGDAQEKGDYAGVKACALRSKLLDDILYFILGERLKVWERDIVALHVGSGYRVIGLSVEGCRRAQKAKNFFSGEDEEGICKA